MTKEEIKKSTMKKIQMVQNLCKQLELIPTAEQMITPEGFIKLVIYYADTEKYKIDEEKKAEVKEDKKQDDKPATV